MLEDSQSVSCDQRRTPACRVASLRGDTCFRPPRQIRQWKSLVFFFDFWKETHWCKTTDNCELIFGFIPIHISHKYNANYNYHQLIMHCITCLFFSTDSKANYLYQSAIEICIVLQLRVLSRPTLRFYCFLCYFSLVNVYRVRLSCSTCRENFQCVHSS